MAVGEERARPIGELDERANRLAHHLRAAAACGREVRGGALPASARRRWWWRCSASSRPAAPTCRSIPRYPASGWRSCSTRAAAALLRDRGALLARLPAHGARPSAARQRCRTLRAQPSAGRRDARRRPETSAYVIYTSGSTGRPKGVMIAAPRGGELPAGAWPNGLGSARGRRACPLLAALSSTSRAWRSVLPLVVGGRLELVAPEEAADGAGCWRRAWRPAEPSRRQAARPRTWRLLLDAGLGRAIPGLRLVLVRRRGAAARPGRGAGCPRRRARGTSTAPPRRTVWSATLRRGGGGRASGAASAAPIANTRRPRARPRLAAGAGRRAGRAATSAAPGWRAAIWAGRS